MGGRREMKRGGMVIRLFVGSELEKSAPLLFSSRRELGNFLSLLPLLS